MKKLLVLIIKMCILILVVTGCTQNIASHSAGGAAFGAGGSMFVGALTDLIIHGKIDSATLTRNAVTGGIVGGAGGAAVGYKKDKAEENSDKMKQSNMSEDKLAKLKKRIGDENFNSLSYLILCKHEDAYRITLDTVKSPNNDYKEAGYILQALIDKDRGNIDGFKNSTDNFISISDKNNDYSSTVKEFDKLYVRLQNERKVKGITVSCDQ